MVNLRLGMRFKKDSDALHKALNGDHHQHHPRQPLASDQPIASQNALQPRSAKQDRDRAHPGDQHRGHHQGFAGFHMGIEHDRGQKRGAGYERNGERSDEGLSCRKILAQAVGSWEEDFDSGQKRITPEASQTAVSEISKKLKRNSPMA